MTRIGRSDEEWALVQYVWAEIEEWGLVESGRCSYRDLGYCAPGGDVFAWKLASHRAITRLLQETREER